MACLRDWKALSVLHLQLSAATGLPLTCQDEALVKMKRKSERVKYRHSQNRVCANKQTYNKYSCTYWLSTIAQIYKFSQSVSLNCPAVSSVEKTRA